MVPKEGYEEVFDKGGVFVGKGNYKNEDWLVIATTDHGGTEWSCMSDKLRYEYVYKYNNET